MFTLKSSSSDTIWPRPARTYMMGFAGSAMALIIVCAAGEALGSGVRRRLARGRALACVGRCRRANVGPGGGGAPDADEPQGRHASDLAKC